MTRNIALFLGLMTLAAPALADTKVITPLHDIARGDIISESDVTVGTVKDATVMGGMITSMDAVRGMEARRVLRAGETISLNDIRHPVVVSKGQTITMTFDAPGVSLTAMGRAMSEGGVGDTVVIQNPASFRMVNAVVTGPGTARATGPAAGPATLAGSMRAPNQLTALQ